MARRKRIHYQPIVKAHRASPTSVAQEEFPALSCLLLIVDILEMSLCPADLFTSPLVSRELS